MNADTLHIETYYDSLPGMLKKYDRLAHKSRFTGQTAGELAAWQKDARAKLWEILGLDLMEHCDAAPVEGESVLLPGGVRRTALRLQVEPGVWMPVYRLDPASPAACQLVFICPPGHMGAGKYTVAGCGEIPAVQDSIEQFNYDYGLQFAQQGHVVFCPDCRGFGERRDTALQTDDREAFLNSTCFHLAHMAEPLGMCVAGMLAWDLMRLADYIEQYTTLPMARLACAGFSGGGMQTLWLAALDTRVRLAVISGYMYGYRDSLLKLNGNCSCNYVPGLWRHFDMGDIAALIAPRALVVQSCRDDDLNGERGLQNVYEQTEIIRRAYALYDAPGLFAHDVCEGGHRWHDENLTALLGRLCAQMEAG